VLDEVVAEPVARHLRAPEDLRGGGERARRARDVLAATLVPVIGGAVSLRLSPRRAAGGEQAATPGTD